MYNFNNILHTAPAQIIFVIAMLMALHVLAKRFIIVVVRKSVRVGKHGSKKEERQREDTLIAIFRTASAVALWAIGIITSLGILGVNLTAMLTGAGLVGVLVGFGAQSTIKDFLAGIFVILENQYRVGDVVAINGISGMVDTISIRMTKLRDLDGTVHFIPNGEITTVSNMTYDYSNVNLNIDVAYDTDIKKLEQVLNTVGNTLALDKEWQDKIIEPIQFLRVDSFGDSAISVKVLGKVTPAEQWAVAGEYRRRLKTAFDSNHIEIPYPQRVIHHVTDN